MKQLNGAARPITDVVRRRVTYWGLSVLVVISIFIVQSIFPQYRIIPFISNELSPLVIVALILIALICEYIDSSLGMGYGTTLTPLLLLFGFEPLQIVPCVLLSEFATGLTSAVMHHKDGNVDFIGDPVARRSTVLLSLLSVVGAVTAVFFALKIPKFWLKAIIGVIILSVGITILSTIKRKLKYRRGNLITLGAIAAFNKGLSGGGYGPIVTAGQVVSGIPARSAVAITSLAESLTCIVGLTAYILLRGGDLVWTLAAPLTIGAMLSVPLATITVRILPEKIMKASVGVVTVTLGILTLLLLIKF